VTTTTPPRTGAYGVGSPTKMAPEARDDDARSDCREGRGVDPTYWAGASSTLGATTGAHHRGTQHAPPILPKHRPRASADLRRVSRLDSHPALADWGLYPDWLTPE